MRVVAAATVGIAATAWALAGVVAVTPFADDIFDAFNIMKPVANTSFGLAVKYNVGGNFGAIAGKLVFVMGAGAGVDGAVTGAGAATTDSIVGEDGVNDIVGTCIGVLIEGFFSSCLAIACSFVAQLLLSISGNGAESGRGGTNSDCQFTCAYD